MANQPRRWKDRLPGYRGLSRAARRLRDGLVLLPAICAVMLCRLLRPIVLVRFGWIRASRIGHLVFETDLYLCERRAGLHPRRSLDLFYFDSPPCNRQVAAMFRRCMWIHPLVRRLDRVNKWLPGGAPHQVTILGRDTYFTPRDTHDLLVGSPAELQFTAEERRRGDEQLERLGIPRDAAVVCVHNRDSAFLREQFPHEVWDYHDYRDFSVEDLRPTVDELVRRGYYVVRVGQQVAESLDHDSPRVIDYASGEPNDFLDAYLCARCRFFVGNTSGLFLLATAFRRPVVSVNHVPFGSISICASHDLVLPKLLWSEEKQRVLTLPEVVAAGAANLYLGGDYVAAGLRAVSNDPEDIRAAAAELDDRLHGRFQDTPRDQELAEALRRIYDACGHVGQLRTRVAATFLRRHSRLFETAPKASQAA
ncbi:MAG: TIGR04372 family glycosyltransferase [Pirellulaceae bacterium]